MSTTGLNLELLSSITRLLNRMSYKDLKLDKNFGLVKFYAGTPLDNGGGDTDVEECDDILRHNLYHLAKLVANVKQCVIFLTQHALISLDTKDEIFELKQELLMSVGMWCEIVKLDKSAFPTVMEIFVNFGNDKICTLLAVHCNIKMQPKLEPKADRQLNRTNNLSVTPQPAATAVPADVRPAPASAPPVPVRVNGLHPDTDWNCTACTYQNLANNNSCTLCYSPRPRDVHGNGNARTMETDILERSPFNAEIVAGAAAAAAATSGWSCGHCTFHNGPNATVCSMCCKTKDSGLEVTESPEAVVGATKSCPSCTVKNNAASLFCEICNELFPDAQPEALFRRELNHSGISVEASILRGGLDHYGLDPSSNDVSSDDYE